VADCGGDALYAGVPYGREVFGVRGGGLGGAGFGKAEFAGGGFGGAGREDEVDFLHARPLGVAIGCSGRYCFRSRAHMPRLSSRSFLILSSAFSSGSIPSIHGSSISARAASSSVNVENAVLHRSPAIALLRRKRIRPSKIVGFFLC